ncbi:hypothetical protein TrVGV298_007145 [Trichoderma virens]|nr:hypothetical protein TrVGV298_007145 [Trichoderma virens]
MSHLRNVDNNSMGNNATIHLGDNINNEFHYVQERRETPLRPFPLIPFRRDPDFVDRGDILNQISLCCLEPAGRVALLGLGGVGKSQLAIEFAHRIAGERNDIWVFWIHAATQARVEEGFRNIADAVKLAGRDQPTANIPLLVQKWLSNEPNGRWIIILDSADNSEVLYSSNRTGHDQRSLAAYIPQSRNGSIVLTTRSRDLASKLTGGYKNIIDVGPMTEADAVALLKKKTGSPVDICLAKDLVRALECIPLAVSQAAAYIQARKPRSSIEKYLVEFRKSERESMRLLKYEATDIGRDGEASNAVLKTWTISFEYIRSHQRSAADLLSLMSFFDRQSIPEWVLKKTPDKTEDSKCEAGDDSNSESETRDDPDSDTDIKFEEDISTLRNYCLIAENEEGNKFEMHRLVQLSIKNWLKTCGLQETFMHQYIKQMAASFPRAKYENWAICQELFAHVQVALDYRPNEDTTENWATLCYQRMAAKAKKAYEKKFGKDHDSTLTCMSLLASTYRRQGRFDEAEKLEVQLVETSKTKLGADHPDTLTSIHNLASTYRRQGRWDEAEKLGVQLVEVSKTKLGADHPDTLTSINNLALTYWQQGRWNKAEKLQVQVLETRKAKLGADHPNTLRSMKNLASTYRRQGRWDEAEKLEVQVLETRKAKLGADHPSTLSSMHNLASTYWNQGRWDEAEKLEVQVLETRKAKLGADHPSTLSSMNNLASTYWNQGRWDEAEKLEVQVLETRKAKLGADHPDTIRSMSNLAYTWKDQGRHEDALALMKDCLQARQRVLGLQHPDTLISLRAVKEWENDGQ